MVAQWLTAHSVSHRIRDRLTRLPLPSNFGKVSTPMPRGTCGSGKILLIYYFS